LAAVDAKRWGNGFDSMQFEVIRGMQTVVDETFTDSALALALFQDRVWNLGDIETGSFNNFVEVTVRLSVTTDDIGAGFSSMFVLANSALPEWDADFDVDTDVDDTDLATWEGGYAAGTMHSQGDADRDGDIDGLDFLIWQQQYTGMLPIAANVAVPEPAAGVFLLMAATILLLLRSKADGSQLVGLA
jgi:hypothetical protein